MIVRLKTHGTTGTANLMRWCRRNSVPIILVTTHENWFNHGPYIRSSKTISRSASPEEDEKIILDMGGAAYRLVIRERDYELVALAAPWQIKKLKWSTSR